MDRLPAVIIHSLNDVKRVMAPRLPVLLLSSPAAGLYGGCLWWLELLRAAEFSGPSLLDCGDAPGRAVEAVRLGVPGVILTCEPALFDAVGALAAIRGAILVAARPPALDMGERGAERRLLAWLGGDIA
jgi:hypothetical protein